MNTNKSQPAQPRAKRRWVQYSLRNLLAVVLLFSIPCSFTAVKYQAAKRQSEAVKTIRGLGGAILYDHESGRSNHTGSAWLRSVFGDDLFANVTDVSLWDVEQVTDADLENLKRLPQLEALAIGGTKITDASMVHLKGLTQLEVLHIRRAQITDAGLKSLAGLVLLQELILVKTHVTDEGVERLQEMLPNCEIRRLPTMLGGKVPTASPSK